MGIGSLQVRAEGPDMASAFREKGTSKCADMLQELTRAPVRTQSTDKGQTGSFCEEILHTKETQQIKANLEDTATPSV